jgi:hypothetical protein
MDLFLISFQHMKKYLFFILLIKCLCPLVVMAQAEEFYGQFSSWVNLKDVYHAVGDGVHDDTQALQNALNDLGQEKHSPVLYIPKGTYNITATLTMQTRIGIAVIGEDPLTTIIKWNGDAGKKMFLLNGVSYSEFARITWDGNNKALAAVAHEWDMKVQYANSGTQHTDEIFRNVAVGLKSGANMDAEFSIRRCRFYNCSSTGISLQGWNALDWWVWDCYFENCYAGIANNLPAFGAGNFHVYRSIFKNSSFADISLGNSNYFSFRDNISYNSNKFIAAKQFSNTSPITIQHNLIINRSNLVMADLFTKGNVLFLDNIFVTPDSNKNYVIHYEDNYKGTNPDLTMIGNLFTAKQKILQRCCGKYIDIDNKYGIVAPPLPALNPAPFEGLVKYTVYEVNNKMTIDGIQSIINKAAEKNKKTIIHFMYGTYNIPKTLQIPSGAPLILIGDGLYSVLKWTGDTAGPLMQVNYPAKAIVRNLKMDGNGKVDGMVVYDNDIPGNTIYANELLVYGGLQTNLLVDGFANTDLRFENLTHNYCTKGTSVKMIGNGKLNATILKLFGCASVGNTNTYGVEKNGRLIVYDDWYENSNSPQFTTLKNEGEFILNGAKIANANAAKAAFITVDSFKGKVVFTQIIYNASQKSIVFSNPRGTAKLLTLGTLSWTDSTMNNYVVNSAKNNYAFINNRYSIGGSYQLPDSGNTDTGFVKDMMADLRQTLVSGKSAYTKNATHFTISRVMIQNGINNFRLEIAK